MEDQNICCQRARGPGEQGPEGAYPEYDVESEDKILDAAAHFVSFKMLP